MLFIIQYSEEQYTSSKCDFDGLSDFLLSSKLKYVQTQACYERCGEHIQNIFQCSSTAFITGLDCISSWRCKTFTLNIKTSTTKEKTHTNFVLKELVFIKKLCAEYACSLWGWSLPFPLHKTIAKSIWKTQCLGMEDSEDQERRWRGCALTKTFGSKDKTIFSLSIYFSSVSTENCPQESDSGNR